jgi:cytochrome oxidase Cu insertion factor (SCO1/SenC/PrrC family)
MTVSVMRLAVGVLLSVLLAAACTTGPESGGGSDAGDGGTVAVGDPAPGFTLPSASGQQVALAEFTGHKSVLLYFSMGPG